MRRVFITGSANGIGLETAIRFYEADEKNHLILIDLPSLVESELGERFPERMTYLSADITSAEGVKAIEGEMKKGIDVLINNAGITQDSSLVKMQRAQWDSVISVNLTGVFELSQKAAIIMKEQKNGVILNAASVVAHYGNFGQTNYVATKAGVIGMTKTMAKELGKYGVRVNAVAPGFVATKMVQKMPENIIASMEERTPLKRLGKPEDIANAYYFLASEQASYITGTTLNVDGGIVVG